MVKWNAESERTLLLLAIKQAPKWTIDAGKLLADWPAGEEKPTVRAVTDRFNGLRKSVGGGALAIGGGVASPPAATATPIRRPLASANSSSRESSKTSSTKSSGKGMNNGGISIPSPIKVETGVTSTAASPATPVNVNSARSPAVSHANDNNIDAPLNGKIPIGTASTPDFVASKTSSSKKSTPVTPFSSQSHKRKASNLSTSSTSEDEVLTPTNLGSTTSINQGRRVSLARRSKSATPANKYIGLDDEAEDEEGEEDSGAGEWTHGEVARKETTKKKSWREIVAEKDGKVV